MKLVASFGFKYGVPKNPLSSTESWSGVYDVRSFPNPYGTYGARSGLDPEVKKYVLESEGVEPLIREIVSQNLKYVAIGCYGGHGRSVAIAEEIGRRTGAMVIHLNQKDWPK